MSEEIYALERGSLPAPSLQTRFISFSTDQPEPWEYHVLATDEQEAEMEKLITDTLGEDAYDLYVGPVTPMGFDEFMKLFKESFGEDDDV